MFLMAHWVRKIDGNIEQVGDSLILNNDVRLIGTRARQNNTYILGNLWHFHQAHLLPVAVDQGPVAVGLLNW